MSAEGFPAFGQNFRVYFAAMLTFSASAIVSSVLRINGIDEPLQVWQVGAYALSVLGFFLAIVFVIYAASAGLSSELKEGEGACIGQRDINKTKWTWIKVSLWPFSLGSLGFIVLLLTPVFKALESVTFCL